MTGCCWNWVADWHGSLQPWRGIRNLHHAIAAGDIYTVWLPRSARDRSDSARLPTRDFVWSLGWTFDLQSAGARHGFVHDTDWLDLDSGDSRIGSCRGHLRQPRTSVGSRRAWDRACGLRSFREQDLLAGLRRPVFANTVTFRRGLPHVERMEE